MQLIFVEWTSQDVSPLVARGHQMLLLTSVLEQVSHPSLRTLPEPELFFAGTNPSQRSEWQSTHETMISALSLSDRARPTMLLRTETPSGSYGNLDGKGLSAKGAEQQG